MVLLQGGMAVRWEVFCGCILKTAGSSSLWSLQLLSLGASHLLWKTFGFSGSSFPGPAGTGIVGSETKRQDIWGFSWPGLLVEAAPASDLLIQLATLHVFHLPPEWFPFTI